MNKFIPGFIMWCQKMKYPAMLAPNVILANAFPLTFSIFPLLLVIWSSLHVRSALRSSLTIRIIRARCRSFKVNYSIQFPVCQTTLILCQVESLPVGQLFSQGSGETLEFFRNVWGRPKQNQMEFISPLIKSQLKNSPRMAMLMSSDNKFTTSLQNIKPE